MIVTYSDSHFASLNPELFACGSVRIQKSSGGGCHHIRDIQVVYNRSYTRLNRKHRSLNDIAIIDTGGLLWLGHFSLLWPPGGSSIGAGDFNRHNKLIKKVVSGHFYHRDKKEITNQNVIHYGEPPPPLYHQLERQLSQGLVLHEGQR